MKQLFACIFLLCLTSCGWFKQQSDEKEIKDNERAFEQAFNQKDPKLLASFFTEDGVYFNTRTGEDVKGRNNIEKAFSKDFESNKQVLKLEIISISFLGSDEAIEKGIATLNTPGLPIERNIYRALHQKVNGKWLIAELSEIDLEEPISHYDKLKDLNWLIGDWIDRDGETLIQLSGKWDQHKNFIKQKFTVTVSNQLNLEGFQIIGWDPIEETIRSWLFDTDGAFGEGRWKEKDGHWVVETVQTLPDGLIGTSINLYSNIKNDSYTWKSTGREIGGEILPNIKPVTFTRKKE